MDTLTKSEVNFNEKKKKTNLPAKMIFALFLGIPFTL